MDNFNNDFSWSPIIKKTENKYILKNKYEINDLFNNRYKENCILITGQVQSGKTKRIIEIIKESIEKYKFNLIIVIGGYNNKLLQQTQQRLESELKNINPEDNIHFKYKVLEWKNDIERLDSNRVYNILKNSENLKKLLKIIKHQKKQLKNSRILIIDDECDFFSIQNLKASKDKENEENKLMSSSIYEILKEIYIEINKNNIDMLYINVTATPFANIINNYELDFGVKAIYSLPISDEYNGLKYFNKNSSKHFLTNNFFFSNGDKKYIDVITFWLMQTILYFQKNGTEKESELIIFDSIQKNEHLNTFTSITNNIKQNPHMFQNSFIFLKEIFKEFENITIEEFNKIFNILVNNIDDSIIILNSDSNLETITDSKLKIYIGGFMLSRSLTFSNLLVEFFAYNSDSITHDTLLQRCRWFGYRQNLLDYMKIICNEKTKNDLENCHDCVELFFNDQTKNGAKFKTKEIREKISHLKNTTSKK